MQRPWLCCLALASATSVGFGSAESHHRGTAVEHLPVVLESPALVAFFPSEPVRLRKGQSSEDQPAHRFVFRTIVVHCAFDANEFGQCRGHNVVAGHLARRP